MTLSKAEVISEILNELYPDPPRPLNGDSEYQFLVAIVLSAQTTDVAVNNATVGLFKVGGTPETMSALPVSRIEELIGSLGLFRNKAKYISSMAKALVEKHGGKIPEEFAQIASLPGCGPKTVSCFLSQARGQPFFAVDTHVHRLANRWGLSKEKKDPNRVQQDLQEVFPRDTWTKRHLQFIYYGREYCRAKSHDIKTCPVCYAFSAEGKRVLAISGASSAQKLLSSCGSPSTPAGKNILLYADAALLSSNKSLFPLSTSAPLSTESKEVEGFGINLTADLQREVPMSSSKEDKVKKEELIASAVIGAGATVKRRRRS